MKPIDRNRRIARIRRRNMQRKELRALAEAEVIDAANEHRKPWYMRDEDEADRVAAEVLP